MTDVALYVENFIQILWTLYGLLSEKRVTYVQHNGNHIAIMFLSGRYIVDNLFSSFTS